MFNIQHSSHLGYWLAARHGTQADLMDPSGLFLALTEACGLTKSRLFGSENGPVLVLVDGALSAVRS